MLSDVKPAGHVSWNDIGFAYRAWTVSMLKSSQNDKCARATFEEVVILFDACDAVDALQQAIRLAPTLATEFTAANGGTVVEHVAMIGQPREIMDLPEPGAEVGDRYLTKSEAAWWFKHAAWSPEPPKSS